MSSIGQWFQKRIEEAIKETNKNKGFQMYRLSDTGSTGGQQFISAQPADYFGVVDEVAWLVEAKATEASFKGMKHTVAMFKPHQIGAAALWNMAGGLSIGLVYYEFDRRLVAYYSNEFAAFKSGDIDKVNELFSGYIPGIDTPGKTEVKNMVKRCFREIKEL